MKYIQNILLIGLAGMIMWGVYFIVSRQGEAVGPEPASESSLTSDMESAQSKAPAFDAASLEQSLQTIAGRYPSLETGVSIVVAEQNLHASIEGDIPFKAASTAKVIAATYAIHQIESGSYSFDSIIAGAPLKEHIERMIVDSDNDAWYALFDEFGYPAITEFGNKNGASSFDAADNLITPLGMSRFMINLHQGSVISMNNVTYLENLMARSDTGTIALSPEYSSLVRKAGWLEDRQNMTGLLTVNSKTVGYTIFAKSKDGSTFTSAEGSAFINDSLGVIRASLQ